MKRVFQREIQNPLSVGLLEERFPPGTKIEVAARGGNFEFKAIP
jgi:ATP-dependent Clp protease ATP-binding subunit ClpA